MLSGRGRYVQQPTDDAFTSVRYCMLSNGLTVCQAVGDRVWGTVCGGPYVGDHM